MDQVCQLGAKVSSRLALFCIHHVNQVNSRNDSESWCQHHKHCPGIMIIIIITTTIIIIIITCSTSGKGGSGGCCSGGNGTSVRSRGWLGGWLGRGISCSITELITGSTVTRVLSLVTAKTKSFYTYGSLWDECITKLLRQLVVALTGFTLASSKVYRE